MPTPPRDVRPTTNRTPPHQILTSKWPVLHFSHVPHVDPSAWTFKVWGAVENPYELTWDELNALPQDETLCDMHCVTRWSRLDNRFDGVSVSTLLDRARLKPEAFAVMVHGADAYTTNLLLDDLDRPENLLATRFNEEALSEEHGGPVRLLVPHLYLWKSAKWVTGFEVLEENAPGLWEENGYHMRGDPWAEERFGRPDPVRMRRGSRQ